MNRDLESSFVFLWEFLQRFLSFRKWFLKKYKEASNKKKEGKKSLEDLAASVSPVKARWQTPKEWSPIRADNLVLVKFGFTALSVPRFFGV